MGHYGTWNSRETTPFAWLPVAAAVGVTVNEWSGRSDLIAMVSKKAGRGQAAALFDPAELKIEINSEAAFGKHAKPDRIGDFSDRARQFDYPQAAGAVFHEAMHAKFTTFDLKTAMDELGFMAFKYGMMDLEESRIEFQGLKRLPQNRAFLKSCILNMVLADSEDEEVRKLTGVRHAVHVMALSRARVDTGVLTNKNIKGIREQIDAVLAKDLQEKFQKLWREYQSIGAVTPDALLRMYRISREWNDLIEEAATEAGEPSEQEMTVIMGGEGDGDGDGESMPMPEGMFKAIMDAIEEDAKNTEIQAREDVHDQEAKEISEQEAKAREEKANQNEHHKSVARKVFNHDAKPTGRTSSRLRTQRPPTSAERIAAVTVAREMEKAKYRDRVKTDTMNYLPPGRMKTKALVQGAAYKAVGSRQIVEPFKRARFQHVDDPTLTIGVMVDISGSMGSAMVPMSVTAWILSEATRRIEGTAAMVYYGDSVFPTLYPGQHLPQVNIYDAPDGSEDFDTAFKALDGTLELLDGVGARMIVIVSDGQYTSAQVTACEKWLLRCEQAGVGVLWLGFGWSEGARAMTEKARGTYVKVNEAQVTDAGLAIGIAAAKALTNAGMRR